MALIVLAAFMAPITAIAKEMYAEFNEQDVTLTFYYDDLKSTRKGVVCTTKEEWGEYKSDIQNVEFDVSFADARPTDMSGWFEGFTKLEQFVGGNVNTSQVTTMANMFFDCENLSAVTFPHFDTSNVTDMTRMFSCCYNLTLLDLSTFDVSNVENMTQMFFSCKALTYLNLSHFNTSSLKKTENMFAGCRELVTLNLGNFDVSKVVDMSYMFANCVRLKTIYCSSDWQAEAVNLIWHKEMFMYCEKLVGDNDGRYDGAYTDVVCARPGGGQYELGYFSRPVLTIGGVAVTKPGPLNLPSIQEGSVTYTEGDRVGDYPTLTLENATIFCETSEGIVAPDGIILVLKGDNTIYSTGTAIYGYDVFPYGEGKRNSSLDVASAYGYGIHLVGGAALSASEGGEGCKLTVFGKAGAVHGQKSVVGGKTYFPSIFANDMILYLADPNFNDEYVKAVPTVSGIGQIFGTTGSWWNDDVRFSYESYHFDKEKQTVVTSPMNGVVTKSFCIAPKEEYENYGVYLGGEQFNNLNYRRFEPMSLTTGSAKYSPSSHELYLDNARFDYPYEPTDDYYAIQGWATPELKVKVKGECSLTGTLTDDGYDYGISFSADGSETESKPQFTIVGEDKNAKLNLLGSMYIQSTDYKGADVLMKDVAINVADKAYLWGEDDIDVTIDNCNVTLRDDTNGGSLIESLNSLTLKRCSLQDGCYWDASRGCVCDKNGDYASGLLRIVADGKPDAGAADLNGDGSVNVGDVTTLVNMILGKATKSDSADLNHDGAVNVGDVTTLVNMILGK